MPKNIVWICSDQQRADSLGCMGNTYAETPRLDALAGEGTLLRRLISAHPVCMPSRASMLTGWHPTRHGVVTNGIPLSRREHEDDHAQRSHVPTMADHLQAQGYHTRCIGKLHLEPHQAPERYGFRESYAMWNSGANEHWRGPRYGFEHCEFSERHGAAPGGCYDQWLRSHHPQAWSRLHDKTTWPSAPCSLGDLQASPLAPEQTATWWVGQRFADFLRERDADAPPFFCWLGIPDPHHPWQPPQAYAERFAERPFMTPAPERTNAPSWWAKGFGEQQQVSGRTDAEQCAAMVRRYTDAQNALIDRSVGIVLDALEAAGLSDDTIILFTSDHGDFLGDYGLIRKTGYSCASLNRVPGIIRDPGGSLPAVIDGVCGHVDLAPTLCQAAGVPWSVPDGHALQDGSPGVAFVPCIGGRETGKEGGIGINYSLWTDHERLTWFPESDACEVIDHRQDPQELLNAAEKDPAHTRELRERLMGIIARSSSPQVGRFSGW